MIAVLGSGTALSAAGEPETAIMRPGAWQWSRCDDLPDRQVGRGWVLVAVRDARWSLHRPVGDRQ